MDIKEVKDVITYELISEAPQFSFAYASAITTAPNPGLFVKDVGDIGLPLSSRDAEDIIAHCRQSPFGKGSETIVDTSVRNSFELEPGQFELRNPAWKSCIRGLVNIVYSELGLVCGQKNVDAELYKLLLYKEGAFFKSHQDSEKAKGMFGTLVVSLGSSHEGGAVVLEHKKEKFVYKSSKTSQFSTSFAAWYSDVFHEVQKVTAGYRLVLTYNLIQKGTSTPQQAADSVGSKRLANALMRYNQLLEELNTHTPPYLAYKLEHPYTQDSIGRHSLKGTDRVLLQRLEAAGKDLNFSFYLAMFTKQITFDEEYGDPDEEVDRDESFDSIYDLQGSKVRVNADYSRAVLLDDDNCVTDDEDDHESEHEGYTGNEGAPIYRTYKDTMLLIVPPASRCELWIGQDANNPETILRVLEDLRSSPETKIEGSSEYWKLRRLCSVLTDKSYSQRLAWGSFSYPRSAERVITEGRYMKVVAEICLKNNWMGVYERINVEFRLISSALAVLGSYLSKMGLDDRNEKMVYDTINAAHGIQSKFEALGMISASFKSEGPSEAMKQRFDAFEHDTSAKLLEGFNAERKEQGEMLANILLQCGPDSGIAGMVERSVTASATPSQAAFTITFAQRLGSMSAGSQLESAIAILGRIMDSMWANFIFEKPTAGIGPGPRGAVVGFTPTTQPDSISADELFSLLNLSAAEPPYSAFTPIEALSAMHKAIPSITPAYAITSLFIFAERVCKNEVASLSPPKCIQSEGDNAANAAAAAAIIKSFVVDSFVAVIKKCVGPEPKKPTDLSLPPPPSSRCSKEVLSLKARRQPCEDCKSVITFLASRKDAYFEIRAAKQMRSHLDMEFYNPGDPSKVNYGKDDLLFHTEVARRGRLYAWVITKTHDAKYRRDRLEWERRVREVSQGIARCLAVKGNVLAAAGEEESPNGTKWSEVVKAIASARLEEIERVGLLSQEQGPVERTPLSSRSTNNVKKRALDTAEGGEEKVTRKREKIAVIDLISDGE